MTLKAVLIDMDDTLLRLDTQAFTRRYLEPLAQFIITRTGVSADQYRLAFRESMRAVNAGRDPLTFNGETMNSFLREGLNMTIAQQQAIAEEFFAGPYLGLREGSTPMDGARKLIESLKGCGLTVIVATNPLFNKEATFERLRWAAVDPAQVDLITTADNMHFVKPSPHYYHEILARFGLNAEEAIMAGDDLTNDIAPAASIGMATFHVRAPAISHYTLISENRESPTALALAGTLFDLDRAIQDGWPPVRLPGIHSVHLDTLLAALLADVAALHGLSVEMTDQQWLTPFPGSADSPAVTAHNLSERERLIARPNLMRIANEADPFIQPDAQVISAESIESIAKDEQVKRFTIERAQTLDFLTSLSADQWKRTARHAIYGPTTLPEMVAFLIRGDRQDLARFQSPASFPTA